MRLLLPVLLVLTSQISVAQFPEKELKKALSADRIEMDKGNEDGTFKARNKRSKKWGMFQWMYEGTKTKMLIPMEYDSVRYIPFNGAFTAVYNDGKAGFYLSAWSYDDAKQTVPCLYDDYQRFNVDGRTYLAVMKNGKWGWVDWLTGEEKSEFTFDSKDALTSPTFEQKYR